MRCDPTRRLSSFDTQKGKEAMKQPLSPAVAGLTATLTLTALCRGSGDNEMMLLKARQHWALPRAGAHALSVDDPVGTIRGTTTEADEIQIDAVRAVRADHEAEGQAFLAQMKIEWQRDGSRWVVKASWPSPEPPRLDAPHIDFEIHVPRRMFLEVGMNAGSISVVNIAEGHLHLNAGKVHAENVPGLLEVETNAGSIEATHAGEAHLRSNVGRISARKMEGRLEADTNTGDIQLAECTGPVEATSNMGAITIRQAHGLLKAETAHGSIDAEVGHTTGALLLDLTAGEAIDLRLPDTTSARLEADAGQGISMEPARHGQYNPQRTHLEATLGGAQGSIRLHAGRGAIQIRLAGEK
jgi:hypothetical protein